MSNIDTCALPPKTTFSFASALIIRLFLLSCNLLALMYTQIFLTASVRGTGLLPITSAKAALGVIAFIKAAEGLRADFFFAGLAAFLGAAFFGAAFFAAGLAAFFGAAFFTAFFGAAFLAAGLAAFFGAAFFAAFFLVAMCC